MDVQRPSVVFLLSLGACSLPPKPAVVYSELRPHDPVRLDALAITGTAPSETEAVVEQPDPTLLETCNEPRRIVIFKAARQLELRCGDALAARYATSLGTVPEGHKTREGDGKTPEGSYFVTGKWSSQYHRSLQLAYPNIADAEAGLADGAISQSQHDAIVRAVKRCRQPPQNTALGSLIQLHGSGGGPDVGDWTLGCIAVDNPEIEAVFAFHRPGCDDGVPRTLVEIKP